MTDKATLDPTKIIPLAGDAAIDQELPTITDEFMRERLATMRTYTLMLLRKGPNYQRPTVDPIIWEHGRRNMALREAGLMPIVCPVRDDGEWAGIGIFTVEPERASEIISEDPAVKAEVLTAEVHPIAAFPGAGLPETP